MNAEREIVTTSGGGLGTANAFASHRSRSFEVDDWTLSMMRMFAALAAGISVLIVSYLLIGSLPALQAIGLTQFLTDHDWHPTRGEFSLVPMLLGTLWVTVGSVLLASPFAVASAIFGRFFIRGVSARIFRRMLETLAGIPSVVFGLWGLTVLVPRVADLAPPGQSVLAGILVLSMMILPTIALLADSALAAVPEAQLRAGAAAGLSRWSIVRGLALPAARSGIGVGIVLGAGRALGETMAVVMVMGNVVQIPSSLFDPARTLTANIALEMAYASSEHRSALFVSGLVLALLTIFLVWMGDRLGQDASGERSLQDGV